MNKLIVIPIVCALMSGCAATHQLAGISGKELPVGICFVPEMDYIPEKYWAAARERDYPEDVKRAVSDWKKKSPWVARWITPDLVRSLSRWARQEMKEYDIVPSLSNIDLRLACKSDSHRKLLFVGTVDTLPSHFPGIVTRWLKLFLIYDIDSRSIIRATVTIQGQRLE